jgi:transposase
VHPLLALGTTASHALLLKLSLTSGRNVADRNATLLRTNKRLNTAYLLKESFGQLWSYEHEGWARRFFENWRAALKWQRLKPYEKFAAMIDRHWDGIAAYCKPRTKSRSASSRGSTTRSASSKDARTEYEMKNISV